MQRLINIGFKAIRKGLRILKSNFYGLYCKAIFYLHNVKHKNFKTNGVPFISIALNGTCEIGKNFVMNNGLIGNPIGRPQRCVFFVDRGAKLQIGKNVGISSTALIAHTCIIVEDNVKIGGGVCIYDTDFHSLNTNIRNTAADLQNKSKAPVIIRENAFIGAHSTILKGVIIGKNSIVGACSVVTKSVPANEIWAGNPAKFIKRIDE